MFKRLLLAISRGSGPIALPLARSGLIPLWAVVHHRGRRSGKAYATPIAILSTPDSFMLPLPWGEGTDWCRNLRAAGGGVVHWRGADHAVTSPEVIDAASAAPAFSGLLRPIVRALGIKNFLRVRRTIAAEDVRPPIERTA